MADGPVVDGASTQVGIGGAQPTQKDQQKQKAQKTLVEMVAAAAAKAKAAKAGNPAPANQAKPDADQANAGAQGPSGWERAAGCLRAAGGAFQMGAGAFAMANVEAPVAAQALGAFAIAHGASDWQAGAPVCLGESPRPSPFETTVSAGMQAFGVDPKNADSAARKADIAAAFMTPGGGPAAFSGGVRLGSEAPAIASSATARMLQMGTKTAQEQSLASNITSMAMNAAGGSNDGKKAEDTAAGGSKKPGESGSADKPPTGEFKDPKYTFDAATGQYRDLNTGKFVSPGDLPWPDNYGFASSTRQTVPAGTILDRVGKDTGRFLGEPGSSISARGLPNGSQDLPYHQYRVLKPVDMRVGPASPSAEYGATGGATQYQADLSIKRLIEQGYLEIIK
jgi:hypothetical protein